MKLISSILIILLTLIVATPLVAAENEIGRYQAFHIASDKEHTSGGTTVFILDTKDGYIWIYTVVYVQGVKKLVEGIRYIGKVRPGRKAGELIEDLSKSFD